MRYAIQVQVQGKSNHTHRFPKSTVKEPRAKQNEYIFDLNTSTAGGRYAFKIIEVLHDWDEHKQAPVLKVIVSNTEKKFIK